jgi:co-chaperonin GroES (HSP10)
MIEAKGDIVVVDQLIRGKTSSGLIVPNIVDEPQAYGRVTSVGEEVKNYKVDDVIIFHKNGGMVVVLENKLLRVLKEPEIYGILVDAKVLSTLEEANLKREDKRVVTP